MAHVISPAGWLKHINPVFCLLLFFSEVGGVSAQVTTTCMALSPATGLAWLPCKIYNWTTTAGSVGPCLPSPRRYHQPQCHSLTCSNSLHAFTCAAQQCLYDRHLLHSCHRLTLRSSISTVYYCSGVCTDTAERCYMIIAARVSLTDVDWAGAAYRHQICLALTSAIQALAMAAAATTAHSQTWTWSSAQVGSSKACMYLTAGLVVSALGVCNAARAVHACMQHPLRLLSSHQTSCSLKRQHDMLLRQDVCCSHWGGYHCWYYYGCVLEVVAAATKAAAWS